MNLKTIAYSIVFAAFFTAGFLSYQNSSLLSKNEEFSLENLIVKAYADLSDSNTCLSCAPEGVDDDGDGVPDNYTCSAGGPGSSECSTGANGSAGGGGIGTNCSVKCNSGYYSCCNAYYNKCQCRQ